jgi:hypothetical protein
MFKNNSISVNSIYVTDKMDTSNNDKSSEVGWSLATTSKTKIFHSSSSKHSLPQTLLQIIDRSLENNDIKP